MASFKIAVLIGSLRAQSFNHQLATAAIRLAPGHFGFDFVSIADLPLYNQDDDDNPVSEVTLLKSAITAANGVLFVTPEYNRSIPGVLKNAIDHAGRFTRPRALAVRPRCVINCVLEHTGD